MNKIPLVDIKLQYQAIKDQVNELWMEAFDRMELVLGKNVQEFEKEFAAYNSVKYSIGVGSGTDALTISLLAAGIKPGDEIVTVSHTFIATVESIILVGAIPKLVDIDSNSYTIDVSKIEITPRTKAIIPVHLYGYPANMTPILELAKKYNLIVIEDASQAHGAEYRMQDGSWRKVGSIGHIATWSFYFSKNLGALGEAGAITTNDANLANRVQKIRNHGRSSKYEFDMVGWNSRLDEIQAAILRAKLKRLDSWNDQRRQAAKFYIDRLKGIVKTPIEREWGKHVYHCFVVETDRRNELVEYLKSKSIETGIHYPVPTHKQVSMKPYMQNGLHLPMTEKISSRILSLPIYPGITNEQLNYICNSISEFFG